MKITVERLRELLEYDPETGVFTRKQSRPGYSVGSVCGNTQANGYVYIKIDGKSYMAHRLAWLHVNGEWPASMLDHINGRRSDNRLANLREATREINAQNQRQAQRHNKTRTLGVYKYPGGYRACIRVNGRTKHLGCFKDQEVAGRAYLTAKRKYHEGCAI